jgi:hypothetical protein
MVVRWSGRGKRGRACLEQLRQQPGANAMLLSCRWVWGLEGSGG